MIKFSIFRKQLILLSSLTALSTNLLSAEIIYTDINPDASTISGFDFNQDGTNEFNWDKDFFTFEYSWSEGGTNIWASGTSSSGWDVPQALDSNTSIGNSGNFIGYGDASMDAWGAGTSFPINQDKYIGVRIEIDGQIHYGWICVNWNGSAFIFKDYAYESTPNTAIPAGAKPGSSEPSNINNINASKGFSIYPNPASNEINLVYEGQNTVQSISLYDINGRLVAQDIWKQETVQKLDISTLQAGTYFVVFHGEHSSLGSQQIVIK